MVAVSRGICDIRQLKRNTNLRVFFDPVIWVAKKLNTLQRKKANAN
jgi:hypothetical protein